MWAGCCWVRVGEQVEAVEAPGGAVLPAHLRSSCAALLSQYPNLPYLGELQSARVGTDGSGFFPGWRLQLLVVTHLPTGRVWQFRWGRRGREAEGAGRGGSGPPLERLNEVEGCRALAAAGCP